MQGAIETLIQASPDLQSVAARISARDVLQQDFNRCRRCRFCRADPSTRSLGRTPSPLCRAELRQPWRVFCADMATSGTGAGLVSFATGRVRLIFRKSIDGLVAAPALARAAAWPLFSVFLGQAPASGAETTGGASWAGICVVALLCDMRTPRACAITNAMPLLPVFMLILPLSPENRSCAPHVVPRAGFVRAPNCSGTPRKPFNLNDACIRAGVVQAFDRQGFRAFLLSAYQGSRL